MSGTRGSVPEDRQEISGMAKDNAGSLVVWLTLEKVLEWVGKYMLSLLQC